MRLIDTMKDSYKGVKRGSKAVINRMSGHATEEKLAQYSEVYGEILLGMHRDMERHQTLIEGHDQNMRQGVVRVIQAQGELSQAIAQVEADTRNASRFSEQAKSAAVAADGSARECKQDFDKANVFLSEVQRKWQELSSIVEGQKEESRTLDSALKRLEENHREGIRTLNSTVESMIGRQEAKIRTLDLTLKRFRTRVVWASAAFAVVVIIGGLAWLIHFFG